jgi:PUA domain protein
MKKWVLSKHDSSELLEKMRSSLSLELSKYRTSQIRCEEPREGVVFSHLDNLVFVQTGEQYIPFLGSAETVSLFPAATIDEGAIKYMLNGADVMRPGIKSFESWGGLDKVVVIREEKKGRAIAIGRSLVESDKMGEISKGACLKNVHHVGDDFWNLYKTV